MRHRNGFGAQAHAGSPVAAHPPPAARDAPRLQLHQVHGRRADEAGRKGAGGARIHLARRRTLLHLPLVQQHHLVGHAHGFGLVVRDIDHRETQPLLQLAQLTAHFLAQLGIEVGQGLVHQAHLGLRHQRAAQRHTLLLPARKLRGPAVQQGGQAQQVCGFLKALCRLGLGHLAHRQAKLDVVGHGKVRKQRIVLKHHGHAALRRRQMGDILAINQHLPRGGCFEPGNDAQGGGFAAAGRAQKDAKGTRFNAQLHRMQRSDLVPRLGNCIEFNRRHAASLDTACDKQKSAAPVCVHHVICAHAQGRRGPCGATPHCQSPCDSHHRTTAFRHPVAMKKSNKICH